MNIIHNQTVFKLLSVFAPLFYLNDIGKKTVILNYGGTKIKIRVNTYDKQATWEVWELKEYDITGFKIKPKDIVIDIGAHIGAFTIWAAIRAIKGKVYAFEPEKNNFNLLEENIKLNRLGNVILSNKAVSDKFGKAVLSISDSQSLTHSLIDLHTKQKLDVSTINLAGILKSNNLTRINFLKLDAEGAEYDILLNTPSETLLKIDKMIIEYHDHLPHGHNYKELVNFLEKNGYEVKVWHPFVQRYIFRIGLIMARRISA